MQNRKILGIVITYKETKMAEKAIRSLVNADVDVSLVFNGWSENYSSWISKNESHIDFKFLNNSNIGFCRGNNQAMKLAINKRYDYVFLLNNDAWVEEDCIYELVKEMERYDKLGMVQPKVYKAWNDKILDTTGLIFRYGDKYSWTYGLGYVIDRGQNECDEGQYDELSDVIGCCACAVLYRVHMLKRVGLFWEKLWSMGEDVELSWRAYKHGWKAKFVPSAIAYHWRGYSLSKHNNRSENTPLKKLWDVLRYRNWTLTLARHGNQRQKLFTSAMWSYYGCKSWVGKRLGRNNVGGYYIWLCSLALVSEKYQLKMEEAYCQLFKECNIEVDDRCRSIEQ